MPCNSPTEHYHHSSQIATIVPTGIQYLCKLRLAHKLNLTELAPFAPGRPGRPLVGHLCLLDGSSTGLQSYGASQRKNPKADSDNTSWAERWLSLSLFSSLWTIFYAAPSPEPNADTKEQGLLLLQRTTASIGRPIVYFSW